MTAPFNTTYTDGGSPVTADGLNTFVQLVFTVPDARSFIGVAGQAIIVLGTAAVGDGGQGVFYWNATGVAADDNGVTTIVPFGSSPGEWIRIVLH